MDHGPLRLTLVDDATALRRAEVDVDLPGTGAPLRLADVAEELAAHLGAVGEAEGPATTGRWWCEGRPLPPAAALGAPPLVQGAVLVRRPGEGSRPGAGGREDEPSRAGPGRGAGVLHLHVVAGPDAGLVVPLPPGRHVLGRGVGADVRLDDPRLSRRHLRLDVDRRGALVTDLGSANGTLVDGVRPGPGGLAAGTGARVAAGAGVLELRLGGEPPRAGGWDGRGHRLVATTGRAPAGDVGSRVRVPAEPGSPERPRTAWAAALVPLVVAVPMALLWSPWALLMGLASPLVAVVTTAGERRAWSRRRAEARARAARLARAARAEAERAVRAEESVARAGSPGASDVVLALSCAGGRLWERARGGPVLLALGTGEAPSSTRVVVEQDGREPTTHRPLLRDVPLAVDLLTAAPAGVVGPPDAVLATARWVVLQVAGLHAPSDVRVLVLTAPDSEAGGDARWGWARWLPSVGPAGVLDERDEREDAVARLLADVEARADRATPAGAGRTPPRALLVVDDDDEVRATPGLVRLLRSGAPAGVLAVALARGTGSLPDGCTTLVALGGEGGTGVRVSAAGGLLRGTATGVSAATAARAARAAAPLREAQPPGGATGAPRGARLVDLLGGGRTPTPDDVARTWRATSAAGGSSAVPVGRDATGPRLLDLDADGPHALVAGTTGAGKSELLRTLVTSLAVHHSPADLSFVLVDYKGGAAFAGVAGLPHVTGLVTDLDHALTARALRSLGAEVARRERLLREAGAEDLRAYRARRRPGDPALGRLVLVVDEYRVLAEELPDFVEGLVRLAAVGRSLGIHLVLATQRPAGVVGPDVAANVNLRVALRVRDEHDSLDVVESRAAAHLPPDVPGRSLWRVGGGPLEEVQVAATGGAGPRAARVRAVAGGRPAPADAPAPPPGGRGAAEGEDDLARLVATAAAAWRCGGGEAPPSPWLPPLPTVVALPEAAPWESAVGKAGRLLRWGLLDDPAAQEQRPLAWDLARRSHLLVVGGPRSGRTGAARALVAAAAAAGEASGEGHVVVHVVDPGGGLADAADLPAVASVVAHDDEEHARRVLEHLASLVDARRGAAAGRGAHHGPDGPVVVLVVDGWEVVQSSWESAQGGACTDLLHRLLREGPAAGVLVAMTADPRVLGGRTGAAFAERVVLGLADPVDAVLAGLPARSAPGPGAPPGRGVLVRAVAGRGGTAAEPLEVQVARVGPLTGGQVGGGLPSPVPGARTVRRVPRLPPLPRRVTVDELHALAAPRATPSGPLLPSPRPAPGAAVPRPAPADGSEGVAGGRAGRGAGGSPGGGAGGGASTGAEPRLLLGLAGLGAPQDALGAPRATGGAPLADVRADLDGPVWSVLGAPGSGRSTVLAVLERSAAAAGWASVLLSPGGAATAPPGGRALRPAVGDGGEAAAARLEDALRRRSGAEPLVLLVDDAELLEGTALGRALADAADAAGRAGAGPTADPGADPGADPTADGGGAHGGCGDGGGLDGTDGGEQGGGGQEGAPRPARELLRPGDLVVVATRTAVAGARAGGLLAAGRRTRSGLVLGSPGAADGDLLGLPPGARWPAAPPGRGLLVRRGRPLVVQVAVPDAVAGARAGAPGAPTGA
ncbi:FtsK/SpoIIIE domain-containing protein [uncultured Pseudokineococcus sp.]|uniref:FtsK/SpoIIIE domain-containing protein n=1 Tax=uncultured Pseudokineococcus sp. TaxID=1642928 RepID=UPI00261A7D19|nr:FtsK/SpoIIIE domain-containing protein [uncultured Pseudokineococcus sp.]